MRKKITWSDIHSATQAELKKTYRLNDRQLEGAVRQHLYGANVTERRELYQTMYGKRK